MITIARKRNLNQLENCQQHARKIALKWLYLARIGRPEILWSVNTLACAVTKWTKACDKRLCRLISYIHHTCEYKQHCHVGNTAKQCRLGLFQDSGFAGDLEDSKSTSGGILCIFGSHTFVPMSWMCKKQTSVSHSSTEAEIISLDVGSRMGGIPALDLWDLVVEAVHSTPNQINKARDLREFQGNLFAEHHTLHEKPRETNFGFAQLYRIRSHFIGCWFKDGRATCPSLMGRGERSVTFIEECRITNPWGSRRLLANSQIQSQTEGTPRCSSSVECGLRHHKRTLFSRWVSVVHVRRQWSSDKKWSLRAEVHSRDTCQEPTELRLLGYSTESIWTPRSKSNMLTPKTQLADMLTKGKFHTWWVGTSSSTVENIEFLDVFLQPLSFFKQKAECHVQESSGKHGWRRFGTGETETDEFCVKKLPERKEKLLRKSRELRTAQGIKSWIRVLFHRAPGNWCETATKTQQHILKSGDKMTLFLRAPGNWSEVRTSKSEGQGWNSTARSPTIDTSRKSSRTCGKSWVSQTESTSTRLEDQRIADYSCRKRWKPPLILDQLAMKILEVYRNRKFQRAQNLFDITQKLILDRHAEILNVSPIDWTAPSWTRSTLAHDQVIKWAKANVHAHLDSVSCLGKMQQLSEANQRWNAQPEDFHLSNSDWELFGIDGEPIEFEWNIFPGPTSLEILQKIQHDLQDH